MRNISTRHYAATFIVLAIGSAACAGGPCDIPEENVAKVEAALEVEAADPDPELRCLTCPDQEGGGIDTVYVRGPSRWEKDNIRRWLEADRQHDYAERHTSPVRENPGPDATPKGLEAIPDPAYCKDRGPGQMCPNPSEMLKQCLEAAATRAGWSAFCGSIGALFGSQLSARCYAAYLGNKQFRINWCHNAWGE